MCNVWFSVFSLYSCLFLKALLFFPELTTELDITPPRRSQIGLFKKDVHNNSIMNQIRSYVAKSNVVSFNYMSTRTSTSGADAGIA